MTARHTSFWVGVVTTVAVAGAPLVAGAGEAHGGGGGGGAHFSGGGGGGAHISGGGAHFSGGGGGHVGFSGGARASFAAPHVAYGGATARAHYAASANHVYGGYPAASSHFQARGGMTQARTGFVRPSTTIGGRVVGGSGRFWGGGYWGGRFWPGCHYGPGFAWFLPVLPFGYATYYWGSNPYYYYDGGYYSWNPDYNGYVATDPPPVADTASSSGSDETPAPADDAQSQSYDVQPQNYAPPPSNPNNVVTVPPEQQSPPVTSTAMPPRNFSGGVADIFAYPRNGQSDQQTSTDKFECHKWSVAQTGFDPTRSINLQGTAADYRRAITACMDARGYTVR